MSFNPKRILNITEIPKEKNFGYYFAYGDYFIKDHIDLIQSNKNAFLSYYAINNKEDFNWNKDIFSIKNKDIFYYVIMNDLSNIKSIINQNKYILALKDQFKRTLLHLAVIGNYYEISEFLLQKGINYNESDIFDKTALFYAKGKILNLLKSYGADEIRYNMSDDFIPKGIVIDSKEQNVIENVYNQFFNKGIVVKMELLKNDGNIIGKRFYRKNWDYKELLKQELLVYHGTKFTSIESIMTIGLYFFNKPIEGHIPLGKKYNNFDNWANAIFTSPSLFYASKYSEIIFSDNKEWYIIIEGIIKKDSFSMHKSTIQNYNFKINEPYFIEYRVGCDKNPAISNGDYEKNILVSSLLFVERQTLDNMNDYYEQNIFKL